MEDVVWTDWRKNMVPLFSAGDTGEDPQGGIESV